MEIIGKNKKLHWDLSSNEALPIIILKKFFPLSLFEANQDGIAVNKYWPFYKHAISCKEFQLFVLTHSRNFIFKGHGFIENTACIIEFFERQTALFIPGFQFLISWVFIFNVSLFKRGTLFQEEGLRLLHVEHLG